MARFGCQYRVTVAAEMDMFPKYVPWVFIEPHVEGANANGKLAVAVDWSPDSTFADVIGAVVLYIEGVRGAA